MTYRGVKEAILWEVLSMPMPKRMARKAGLRVRGAGGGPNIGASFTLINDPLGYIDVRGGAEEFFPEDIPSMDRLLDWDGFSECRLFVTVTDAHDTDATLGVKSGEAFGSGLFVSVSSVGAEVSDWVSLARTDDAVTSRWYVRNPSLAAGSFAIGLCQLQVR